MLSVSRQIFFYLVVILTLITGLSAIYRLTEKADLPFGYHSANNKIYFDEEYKEIRKNEFLYSLDNYPVTKDFEVEFILDSKRIGETVVINVKDGMNISKTSEIILAAHYKNNIFILISLVTGLSFWLTGVYVFMVAPKDRSAKMLCLTLITFSLAILSSEGFYARGSDWLGYLVRISYSISYILGSVFFLHFSFIYPVNSVKKQKTIINLLYILLILLCTIISVTQFISMRDLSKQWITAFNFLWTVTQLVLLLSILSGTLLFVFKYSRLLTIKEKTKLEWIFWGLAAGVSPFVVFSLIPSIFGLPIIVNEEIVLTFLIIIPISFGISVIRYKLFDIEVVIKRSIVYSSLIAMLIVLYFGIIYLLSHLAKGIIGENAQTFNILTAILIALLFNPIRFKVKHFVDSVFYREKYFFDKAINRITSGIKECETLEVLGKLLSEEISNYVHVESIAIIIKTSDGERLRIIEQKNFAELSKNISALRVNKLHSKFKLPFALKDKIDKSVAFDPSLELVFRRWNINLVIPMTLDSNLVAGAIVLGNKLSGLKYSSYDVDLLNAISSSAVLAVKRLELQEKLIIEGLEKSKLKELNELKNYFVASVSHDLKTPLSSINMIAELLRNNKVTDDKSMEYLGMISGESNRLGRMINNVLDYTRIEKGLKKYSLETINLNNNVNRVMQYMSYELMMHKFEIEKILFANDIYINGDTDAINSLIENLFSNAIKYSESEKYLKVSTAINKGNPVLIIEDKGRGISEADLIEIFNPFFRGENTESSKIKGAGLGLSIVKYIIDAHNGSIEVQSEIGKGSIFKIIFPVFKNGN